MQRVSAYQPMAESMPQMLREEAFHLAAGVVPWRRMVEDAARGEVWVSMEVLQKHLGNCCRAASRCSATRKAATPTSSTA